MDKRAAFYLRRARNDSSLACKALIAQLLMEPSKYTLQVCCN